MYIHIYIHTEMHIPSRMQLSVRTRTNTFGSQIACICVSVPLCTSVGYLCVSVRIWVYLEYAHAQWHVCIYWAIHITPKSHPSSPFSCT